MDKAHFCHSSKNQKLGVNKWGQVQFNQNMAIILKDNFKQDGNNLGQNNMYVYMKFMRVKMHYEI